MRIGRYHLRERLGVGGMAEVFRADIVGLGSFRRPVALKRILPQFLPREDFQKMFIDEARICASLTHSNVVQIFDFDKAPDGSFFLVMELIDGVDLKRLIDACAPEPIPVALALHIAVEVLEGLTYAHERYVREEPLSLIHRDVTPSNILLSWAGEVKLVDFGLARARVRLASTQPGIVKGKFAYLAPEQLEGAEIDGRVDIFALGVVLWEMLTGERLFAAESDAETLKKLLARVPEPPSSLRPEVPKDCDHILRDLLAFQPKYRPSAREALQRIGDLLHKTATRADEVDVEAFLARVFRRELSAQPGAIIPQRGQEEESTREIDARKLLELSRQIPNFPVSSPLFAAARSQLERSGSRPGLISDRQPEKK